MAKPTTENISLPDFPVTIVRELDGNFIHDEVNLKEMVANTDKGLILYFYPKDNTPGCTIQATEFTAQITDFDDLGYDIVGVSRDSVESHEKFISKKDLQIPLISDTDEKLCQYFEVIKEK
ncbi:MAG: peroxiredoxin, partial [Psychrobacter sp.]